MGETRQATPEMNVEHLSNCNIKLTLENKRLEEALQVASGENMRLKGERGGLVMALKDALEHENHEEGKCGCGWTLKAETVLKSVGEE